MSADWARIDIRILALALAALLWLALPASAGASPTWLAPENLSAIGHDATEPQIAVDGSGATVAVWARSDGSHTIIQATSRPSGGTWAPAVDLSATGRDAQEPQVAVDGAGDAVAVWSRNNGSHWVIQAAIRSPAGAWSAARDLSDSERSALEPQVAIDSGGRAVAVWSRFDGFANRVQSAVLAPGAGSTWSIPVDLSSAGEPAGEPQLASDAAGEALAVWSRLEGTDMIAQAATMPPGGAWGEARSLSEAGGDASGPQVAVDPGGAAVAVWSRVVAGVGRIESAEMPPGGQWGGAIELTGSGENATNPQVASAAGRSLAIWTLRGAGSYTSIRAAERPSGGDWQPGIDLTQPGLPQTVFAPDIAIDPSGNAAAVWARSGASPTVIEGRVKPAGGPWTAVKELSELGSSADEPQVTLGATGDGASIWARVIGPNTIVQGAGFDGAGPLFSTVSIPAAATARQPVTFAASTFDNWSPVASVVWSFGDSGEGALGGRVEHTFASPGTYPISVLTADNLGNISATSGPIMVYRIPNAGRYVRVRRGAALLAVHCPSPAGCTGVARLIARVQVNSNGRTIGRRAQIGHSPFSVPGGTSPVAIRLTRAGLAAVREGGARTGLRTQLTGPGIQHRLVLLLPPRH
jgi:hypothetical protein